MAHDVTRPDSTVANNGGDIIGGASVHGVLSDDSIDSFMLLAADENCEVGFANPTIPPGAKIKRIVGGVLLARFANDGVLASRLTDGKASKVGGNYVDYNQRQLIYPVTLEQKALAPNNARLNVGCLTAGAAAGSLFIYEAYLVTFFVPKPTVTVTDPTGTPNTNRPTIRWGALIDTDGGPATMILRVFSSAQYTAGGFNPLTSTPIWERVITQQQSGARSLQVGRALNNATYRAYVIPVQAVHGELHFGDDGSGDPAYSQFTVSLPGAPSEVPPTPEVPPKGTDPDPEPEPDEVVEALPAPAQPTLVVTPEGEYGRVKLELTAGGDPEVNPTHFFVCERMVSVLANGGFEDGAASWDLGGDASISASNQRSGGACLLTTSAEIQRSDPIPIRGGQPFYAEAWARRAGGTLGGTTTRVNLRWLDRTGGEISRTLGESMSTNSGGYGTNARRAVGEAPPGTRAVQVELEVEAIDGTSVRWDDASAGAGFEYVRSFWRDGILWNNDDGAEVLYDEEAPPDAEVVYRARAQVLNSYGGVASSFTSAPASSWDAEGRWFLRLAADHGFTVALPRVRVYSQPGRAQPARVGEHQVVGRRDPVIIPDVRETSRGEIVLELEDDAVDVEALLASAAPVLVHAPAGDGWPPRWVSFGDLDDSRLVDMLGVTDTHAALGWTEVARPDDLLAA